MNEKYKFVKIGLIEDINGIWYFEPSSIEQIKEHWRKYPASIIREGSQIIANRPFGRTDYNVTNQFVIAVDALNKVTRGNIVTDMIQVENMAYNNRISDFENGRKIFLTDDMRVVTLDKRFYEIKETVEKDELTFPNEDKPSLDDVRYLQWDGGEHWYAKIGKLDVVDFEGNQKWDSKEDAQKAAKWYVEKYW